MVRRVVVGAHYGLKDWLAQRVTAVVMATFTVLMVVVLLASGPITFASWKALFASGWMRFACLLFVVSMLMHAWVGVRDIVMDYVKPTGIRLVLHVLVIIALVGYAGWAVQILWRT